MSHDSQRVKGLGITLTKNEIKDIEKVTRSLGFYLKELRKIG